jgi:hypothetical protein
MQNPLSGMVEKTKAGMQETSGLGGELKAKSEMMDKAKQALNPSPAPVAPPKPKGTMVYPKDKVNPKGAPFGSKTGEKRIPEAGEWAKPLGQMHDGGTVPESGMYKMKKGEHVLTKDQHGNMNHAFDLAGSVLAHQMPKSGEPKKEVMEMRIRKAASGGHIIKHVHVDPAHPDEDHVTHDTDGLMDHVMHHMAEPNEGEKEADAGDPGIEQMEHAVGYKG